jgi:hypothetical protein
LFSATNKDHDPGVGDGPLCAVLRAGVFSLTQLPIFGLRGEFYHPHFIPMVSILRKQQFWMAGFWSAMHLILLGLAPDPISPWLLYAAVYGKDGLPIDLDYIRALDPTSASILQPWFLFSAADTLDGGIIGLVQQLLITYLDIHEVRLRKWYDSDSTYSGGIQFSAFRQPRTVEEHDGVTRALVSSVLLGSHNPWESFELCAFREGFNVTLGSSTLFEVRSTHLFPLNFLTYSNCRADVPT